MAAPDNILLVAITRMGDMLQASPMIVGLRKQYPKAKITVAIEKQFASICEGIPGIDEVVEIDLALVCQCLHREKDGIVDAFKYVTEKIDELRARKFDLCINMSSSAYTALMLKMLNARDNRGWVSDNEGFRIIENPWTMLFAAFIYHSNRDFNSINLVDIFRCSADVTEHPAKLVYEVPERAGNFPEQFLRSEGITGQGPLISIQAGASQGKRQWLPQRFALLARLLVEQLDARLIFTGSKSERPIVEAIFGHYKHSNMISAVGKTDLGQLASLLKASRVLITGDTGPMHLSIAVGTPVVSLFLASALCFETGPYGPGNIVIQPHIQCSPCNPNLPCSRPDCHDQVPPELVCYLTKLRLDKSDEELLKFTIPASQADPKEVGVYVTYFDEDRFLDFRRMNGVAQQRGFPAGYFETVRAAYRNLWKSELGFMKDDAVLRRADGMKRAAIPGLAEAIECCGTGKVLIDRLVTLIKDPKSPPKSLGEVNEALAKLDRALEDIGLANSLLGAVIRMFIMAKENMRGDDPLVLASQMKGLYDSLAFRCERFGRLFALLNEQPAEVKPRLNLRVHESSQPA